jgi:BASS family bile acid:Na+ symporter
VVDAPAPEVRMDSALVSVGLPIALAIIIFGLGLSLTPADFTRIGRQPKAVVVILLVQVVLLPIVAFALAKGFGLEPGLAVGLMILAASPGGTTANLFSHLFRGDVALNITLTAINSLLALLTLSIVVVASQTSWQTGYEGMIGVTEEEMAYGSTTCDPGGEEDQDRAECPGRRDEHRRSGAQGEGLRAVDRPLEG